MAITSVFTHHRRATPTPSSSHLFFWLLSGMLLLCFAFPVTAQSWGTAQKPFAANSLWNSKPVNPLFSDFEIPRSTYFPSVGEGAYSSGVFVAGASDWPTTVQGPLNAAGVLDRDTETYRKIVIPRWPAAVLPTTGSDGHADIIDPVSGIVHSFYQLKNDNGVWRASMYAWAKLNGSGWGDPAHFVVGVRAAAVAPVGGLIRKHEINNGDSMYRHALSLSLTFNGLSPNPTYIFPATLADTDAAQRNTGKIPEGALLMLPASFNTQSIVNADLRKIAETLKVYGAYVVDRNHGTPFYIYVENGSGFNLHKNGWNNAVANDLDRIRAALRQVVSASGWVDGNGVAYTPNKNLNLLSMRGQWILQSGTVAGVFNSWAQAVSFPVTATASKLVNYSSRILHPVSWTLPVAKTSYRLTAVTTGGARLRLQLYDKVTSVLLYDSGELSNGQTATFAWPVQAVKTALYAISGVGQASSVSGNLVRAVN